MVFEYIPDAIPNWDLYQIPAIIFRNNRVQSAGRNRVDHEIELAVLDQVITAIKGIDNW